MSSQQEYSYDIFVSYSQSDGDWVLNTFTPALEQAGFKVFIPDRDAAIGVSKIINTEQAVSQSRWTVLVLSPGWMQDNWREFEGLLVQMLDPTGRSPRMLPIMLERCELPLRLKALTYANLTIRSMRDKEIDRFVRNIRSKIKIFISYKPVAIPDKRIAKQITQRLQSVGYSVFSDDISDVSTEWAHNIQREIDKSDFFVVLLSEGSVRSEVIAQEIEYAHKQYNLIRRPILLPVRIKYNDVFPTYLRPYLDNLRYAEWRGQQNNIVQVVKVLHDLIRARMLMANLASIADIAQSEHLLAQHTHIDPYTAYEKGAQTSSKPVGRDREEYEQAQIFQSETSSTQPALIDAYTVYEQRLQVLLERVGRNKEEYEYALVFQQRIKENISLTRLYGDTDTRKAERAEILDRLNKLTLTVLRVPFSTLAEVNVSALSIIIDKGISAPEPSADTRLIEESFSPPGGALQISSQVYIERGDDQRLLTQLHASEETITTIRAPRQTGKSSLLLRGVAFAQQQGNNVVFVDIQLTDQSILQNINIFLHYIASVMVKKLGLDREEFESRWQRNYEFGAPDNMTYLMEEYILLNASEKNKKVVLAIDEADRLIGTSFHNHFFSMLRAWYNQRAISVIWNKLDILIVISTDPNFLIQNVNQSPFNVGLAIHLKDFNEIQISRLNQKYGLPLEERLLPSLIEFLGGHPYLTSQALYTLRTEILTWEQLAQVAVGDRSPFDDHLRRYSLILHDQSQLRGSLKQIIRENRCSNEQSFYQLLQIGLIKGTTRSAYMRCKLYEQYFTDKLE